MLRVLMISKACLVGAYQRKLEEIARHDGVDLTVIVPPEWRDPAGVVRLERAHTTGYRLLAEPVRFNGRFHLHYYPTLPRRLREIRPHVVHVDEEPYNLATWLAVRQARAVKARTLFFSWQNINRRYPFPFRQMERQVLARVDYALMGNQAAVAVWRAKGYSGPFCVTPQFGVDPQLFTPPAQRDARREVVIGAANRRLVPEKGVDLLLRAAAGLQGAWRLRVMGDGPERPSLQRLAEELGITARVDFDGIVPSVQMPAYLQQLDVLALPSRTLPNWKEQFGRVLIEAMACETAVVGSDSGEIPHVIADAGLIFPEGDVAALQAHLQRLIDAPELRRALGKNGRQRVLETYTQRQIAAQTVAVYRNLAGK